MNIHIDLHTMLCETGSGSKHKAYIEAISCTFSLVNSYFFLWLTRTFFLKNYLRYAMFLYYGTPWTFDMIFRLLKEHKSGHISVFFTHWRVKSLFVRKVADQDLQKTVFCRAWKAIRVMGSL